MSHSYFTHLYFFFNEPPTTEIYTLSLHDALPICAAGRFSCRAGETREPWAVKVVSRSSLLCPGVNFWRRRSEEHTSELQSQFHLVCRLLLEKKKKIV